MTLELSIKLLKQLVIREEQSFLQDVHLAELEEAREQSAALLRSFYKVKKWKIGINKYRNACCMLFSRALF